MITAVDFVSLEVFERITAQSDMACISIGDPCSYVPISLDKYQHQLRLEFLDVEMDDLDSLVCDDVAFNRFQLAKLMQFVNQLHRDTKQYRLVVHCRMGISRSAGVALVVEDMCGCDFPRKQEACHANRLILDEYSLHTNKWIRIPSQTTSMMEFLPTGKLAI